MTDTRDDLFGVLTASVGAIDAARRETGLAWGIDPSEMDDEMRTALHELKRAFSELEDLAGVLDDCAARL